VKRTRVLVVEDSATVRGRLCETLTEGGFEVVGEAADGERAIALCQSLRPDVVTMDMMLPGLTGLDATEHIMALCPTPILIVSSSTNRGELFRTYDALAAGAVDVLEKPGSDEPDAAWDERFCAAVRMVARIRVITHPRLKLRRLAEARPLASERERRASIVALGVSTGGPRALLDVLGVLPRDYPLPVIAVIHLGGPFGSAFAEWLDREIPLKVEWARTGAIPQAGRVALAPPDVHLAIRGRRFVLTRDPERHSCRPSVDVLFESIAADYGPTALGCLLTGMGRDGAAGLLAIRQAGGTTIAQDEASSVVFGMPREAVLLGAAERVLALAEIGPALAAFSRVAT
jgi:two-component system chemotaxis response regulator CheB